MPKRLISGLMAVWLSGFVFLFCCDAAKTGAAEIDSCPLSKAGHCHQAASKDENIFRLEAPGGGGPAFDCCGFLPVVFNKFKKLERSTQIAALPTKLSAEQPALRIVESAQPAPVDDRSYKIDRREAYLKNCVFRI